MNKQGVIFSLCVLITSIGSAQNLVPNANFEEFLECPKTPGRKQNAVANWVAPTSIPFDYFNACSQKCGVPENELGNQQAKSGKAYIGITVYNKSYRSYAQVQLTQPLIKDVKYTVEFNVCLAEKSKFAVGNIAAYFTAQKLESKASDVIETYETIDAKGVAKMAAGLCRPQLKNNTSNFISDIDEWTTISGSFKALGGEQFLTIGNFATTAGTPALAATGTNEYAYYFMDDVMVYQSGAKPELVARNTVLPDVAITRNEPAKTKEVKPEAQHTPPENKQLAELSDDELIEAMLALKDKEPEKEVPKIIPVKKEAVKQESVTSSQKPVILERLFFEKNSAKILPESEQELMTLANFMNENADLTIEIAGHTDESGTTEGNKKLSLARAQAVVNFLMMFDVDPFMMIAKGYGNEMPLADNTTEAGRIKNRRVEFMLLMK